MIKRIITILIVFVTSQAIAQVEEKPTTADVPFAVIENVPVYPGCEGDSNAILKKCMSTKILEHVGVNFNDKMISTLGLRVGRHRIAVQFKVDKTGNVTDVRARAEHPALEEEAIRVINSIPQMKPGMQRGKEVAVLYALPIIFEIGETPKEKRARLKAERKKSKTKL